MHCGVSYPERSAVLRGKATLLTQCYRQEKMSMRASTLFGGGECHAPTSLGYVRYALVSKGDLGVTPKPCKSLGREL